MMARAWARARWPLLAALVVAGGVLLVYWRLLLTNRVLASGDAFTYFTPYRDYANEAIRHGRLPLWNPYLFLGVPFLANPQSAVLYPLHWPFAWLSTAKSLAASLALHAWLSGLGTILYARRGLGIGRWGSLLAGLIVALSGFLGAHAGQVNQVSAAAWLPWLLWLLEEATGPSAGLARGMRIRWPAFSGLALVVGLQFLAGHSQTSYINLVALLLVALVLPPARLWPDRGEGMGSSRVMALRASARRLAVALVAIVLGVLLAAVQLLPTWELAQQSVRSGGLPFRQVVSFSLDPRGLLLGLLPTYGDNLAQRFATPAYAEFVAYVGVTALILAGVGLVSLRWERSGRWVVLPAVALVLVGLGLALGRYNPLTYLLYALVPGFDLFRTPARWLLLYTVGTALLAGFGLQLLNSDTVRASAAEALTVSGIGRDWRSWLAGDRGQARSRRGRLLQVILGAFGVLLLVLLVLQYWPRPQTLALWLVTALALWLLCRRQLGPWRNLLVLGMVLAELMAASLALDHTRPTAPEAVTGLRTAPLQLLAAVEQDEEAGRIPGRFLSMSGITYDPGDLADMERRLAGQLPAQAIYDYVVAAKLQEIVAPNLPLLWRLPAVDGYDGGVLPLERYVDLQTLFVPPDKLAPDGRLREQLQEVPSSHLLRLLGVEYVITDKGHDRWLDDVYYDLQFSNRLMPGQTVNLDPGRGLDEVTAVGLFSYLEGASDLPTGASVGEVVLTGDDGRQDRFLLRAGVETAEGLWLAGAAHEQAARRQSWPQEPGGWDYLARLELATPFSLDQIEVKQLAPVGTLVLRGISLIDGRTGAHAALTLPADGAFQRVHSGDVKVYRHGAVLPRAYVVGQAQIVADDQATLAALGAAGFDPAARVVLLESEVATTELPMQRERLTGTGGAGLVRVQSYRPEEIELEVELSGAGLLVVGDSWYPGWQARVDGQPAPILRANLLFRAVPLDGGKHRVSLTYRPASLRTGALVSGVALLVLVGFALLGVRSIR